MTLEFASAPFVLRGWVVLDAQGRRTRVSLVNPVWNADEARAPPFVLFRNDRLGPSAPDRRLTNYHHIICLLIINDKQLFFDTINCLMIIKKTIFLIDAVIVVHSLILQLIFDLCGGVAVPHLLASPAWASIFASLN